MIDGHIHIERGEYTLEWIRRFADNAMLCGLDEIWLLEHCYRFEEFMPMYDRLCERSEYINRWLNRKGGVLRLEQYLALTELVRAQGMSVKIKFGLEICYFEGADEFVYGLTKDTGLDFLVGSVHFVDGFPFDHKAELWEGVDVDAVYDKYFDASVKLANCGIYSGIGHPDCIKLFGHKPSYALNDYYERLAGALAKNNMYAEQSSGIFARCYDTAELGMSEGLLQSMKRNNVEIITVSDAHSPDMVGFKINELSRLAGLE